MCTWPFVNLCPEDPEEDCCRYTGPNLPTSGINTGDTLNVVVQKLDALLSVATTTTTTTSREIRTE